DSKGASRGRVIDRVLSPENVALPAQATAIRGDCGFGNRSVQADRRSAAAAKYGVFAGMVSSRVLKASGKLITGHCRSNCGRVSPRPSTSEAPSMLETSDFSSGNTSTITLAPNAATIGT